MGVTPNLVGGSWVGGEHRSIHFRTGELGQGSRTALPIFAYFMEGVLKDKHLTRYRGRFSKPKETIRKPYGCQGLYHPKDTDSIAVNLPDSLQESEEDIPTSF